MGSLCLLIGLYFLPVLIALFRRHNNGASILVINTFLGWTLIGWVVALSWSLSSNTYRGAARENPGW